MTKIERLRAALHEAKLCMNPNTTDYERVEHLERGTPAELGEMAGKADYVKGYELPLDVRVLGVLAKQPYGAFDLIGVLSSTANGIYNALAKLRQFDYVIFDESNGTFRITPKGRNYLAGLDKPTPTQEYYPDDYPLAEGKTRAKLNIK